MEIKNVLLVWKLKCTIHLFIYMTFERQTMNLLNLFHTEIANFTEMKCTACRLRTLTLPPQFSESGTGGQGGQNYPLGCGGGEGEEG